MEISKLPHYTFARREKNFSNWIQFFNVPGFRWIGYDHKNQRLYFDDPDYQGPSSHIHLKVSNFLQVFSKLA